MSDTSIGRYFASLVFAFLCFFSQSFLRADSFQVELRDRTNGDLTNAVWFGTNNMSLGSVGPFVSPAQYGRVTYTVTHPESPWNIRIYTHNTNYLGLGSKAGLINLSDNTKRLPLLWQVYDHAITNVTPVLNTNGWVHLADRTDPGWPSGYPGSDLVQGSTNTMTLAPYPVSSRVSPVSSPLCVYFLADVSAAMVKNMNGTYKTAVYIDFNHYLPSQLTLDSISPDKGFSSEKNKVVTVVGHNFQPGATVKLMLSGQSSVMGEVIQFSTNILISVFNLNQCRIPGYYDMAVTNPDSQSSILPQVFLVQGYDMTGNKLIPVNNLYLATPGNFMNIKWSIESSGKVFLKVCNTAGEVVKTIEDDDFLEAGSYQFDWDGTSDSGRKVSSGIYFLKIRTAGFSDVKKLVVVR